MENELRLKLAALGGISDAFVGDIHAEFENMLRNRTASRPLVPKTSLTIEKAMSALMDVLQEYDWDGYHRAILKAIV